MAGIRKAAAGDIEALLRAYEWLFAPPGAVPPGWDPDKAATALAEAIAAPDSEIFVAEEDGSLIGLCSAYLDLNSVRFGRRCWVEDLAVDPSRRSGGVGKALLDAVRSWAAERGASHLELDSGDARTDAHRFYEREGPAWTSRQFSWLV